MMSLLTILFVYQEDDLNKLLNYFFDFSNPVIYSILITFILFLFLSIYYATKIIPKEKEEFKAETGVYKGYQSEMTQLVNMDPDPVLRLSYYGYVTHFNKAAEEVLPLLTAGVRDLPRLFPHTEIPLGSVMGKNFSHKFTFFAKGKYYSARVSSVENAFFAMLHMHDSTSYFGYMQEYKEMVDAVSRARVYVHDRLESEQKRIATELHDSLGQVFTAAKINLGHIDKTSDMEEMKKIASETIGMITYGIDELKDIAFRMRPKMLEEMGLPATIKTMLNRVLPERFLKYEFYEKGDFTNVPPEVEVAMYRITQECISNIIKHSNAKHLTIMLINNKNILRLLLNDNGVGFNFEKSYNRTIGNRKSMGLTNIMDRIELFGGSISFDDGFEEGTFMTIELPIKHKKDERPNYLNLIS